MATTKKTAVKKTTTAKKPAVKKPAVKKTTTAKTPAATQAARRAAAQKPQPNRTPTQAKAVVEDVVAPARPRPRRKSFPAIDHHGLEAKRQAELAEDRRVHNQRTGAAT